MKHRKAIIAGIAAIFGVGFLFGCCSASVVFWALPRGQSALPPDIKGAAQKKVGEAPKDDMTFQELEDRLNAAGFRVHRTASNRGRTKSAMWFGEGLSGEYAFSIQANEDVASGTFFQDGLFRVSRFPDSKQASDRASNIEDIEQSPVLAWGPFLFEGKREVLDNVKAALSK